MPCREAVKGSAMQMKEAKRSTEIDDAANDEENGDFINKYIPIGD
jgi:hypothetical protein